MPSRRNSRQRALQILFLWDARRQPVDETINAYYDTLYSEERPEREPFVDELVRGTVQHLATLDEQISKHAEHWRMERMPAVDRNILRLAVWEMIYGGTPAAVTIDEALELARKYSN
jgi:N utilization substance protein B